MQLLLQFGLDHGLSGDRCLAHTGLDWRRIADPGLEVDARQEIELIRNLVTALGHIPGLGLRAGLRYRLANYGIWGFLLLSCATLRSAANMAVHYLPLSYPLADLREEVLGDILITKIGDSHLPEDVRTFIVDRAMASAVSFVRDLIGTSLPVVSVTLSRPRPHDVRPWEELFGCSPVFDASENCIVKNGAGYLDRRLPGASEEVLRQCEAQCEALLARHRARDGFAAEVRARLVAWPNQLPDMESLAADLNVTSRTLRRRLACEGTSVRQLQGEVLMSVADELLASSLPLAKVGETLGYSEVSNFVRAYRRWKGMTPHQYRMQLREYQKS